MKGDGGEGGKRFAWGQGRRGMGRRVDGQGRGGTGVPKGGEKEQKRSGHQSEGIAKCVLHSETVAGERKGGTRERSHREGGGDLPFR